MSKNTVIGGDGKIMSFRTEIEFIPAHDTYHICCTCVCGKQLVHYAPCNGPIAKWLGEMALEMFPHMLAEHGR